MNFRDHYKLKGEHAFLGASSHSWLNYDKDKLLKVYQNRQAIVRGTMMHDLAAQMIKLKIKFGTHSKITFKKYVDDAIGYDMTPEVVLFYSDNCFGTADAISFDNNFLRIHDLKTGANPASMKQLMIYASIFCLEYNIKPSEIKIELRIYQNDNIEIMNPTSEDLLPIMDKIISFDKYLNEIKGEEK